jgi:hypothetical protein
MFESQVRNGFQELVAANLFKEIENIIPLLLHPLVIL